MSYYSLKFYEERDTPLGGVGEERETVRGLTYTQAHAIISMCRREGIHAEASKYTDDGEYIGEPITSNPSNSTDE